MLHKQIFELCYYGNGFIQSDVYQMPVKMRLFYYNELIEAKKKENKQSEEAKQKANSKVKVRR